MAVSELIAATETAMIAENGRRMMSSRQNPNDEQITAAAVPMLVDLATPPRHGKDRARAIRWCFAAPEGQRVPALPAIEINAPEINPPLRLFSSGVPPILDCTRSAGEHLDR
jgi:hypothetical protein